MVIHPLYDLIKSLRHISREARVRIIYIQIWSPSVLNLDNVLPKMSGTVHETFGLSSHVLKMKGGQ